MTHPSKDRPYGFVVYIDESGDDGLKAVCPLDPDGSTEWLVISAVVVRASNERMVGHWHRDMMSKLKRSQRPDIHFRDLIHAKKIAVCECVANAPLRCFVAMSNKKNMVSYRNTRCYPEKNYLYWWMTRLLLERVTEFCSKWSKTIYGEPRVAKIVFSQRGGMSYERLLKYLGLIKFQTEAGSLFITTRKIIWDAIDLDQILVMNHKSEVGLQFADIVAGAFYQAVTPTSAGTCRPEYAELLIPRLYRGPRGRILDEGVKPMPQLRVMRLLPAQRVIFEILGFPRKGW